MSESSFLLDFKAFVMCGNVIDVVVSVIIGGVFGKIISSVVADTIMPPIGLLVNGANFSELRRELGPARVVDGAEQAAATINYENFIQTMLDSVIIASTIFSFIRLLSSLRRKKEETPSPPPVPSNEERLLSEIRDLLKKQWRLFKRYGRYRVGTYLRDRLLLGGGNFPLSLDDKNSVSIKTQT